MPTFFQNLLSRMYLSCTAELNIFEINLIRFKAMPIVIQLVGVVYRSIGSFARTVCTEQKVFWGGGWEGCGSEKWS